MCKPNFRNFTLRNHYYYGINDNDALNSWPNAEKMSSYRTCTAHILFDSSCFHFSEQWNLKKTTKKKISHIWKCMWKTSLMATTTATVQPRRNNSGWNRNQSVRHPHNCWRSYYTFRIGCFWLCIEIFWQKRNRVKRIGQFVAEVSAKKHILLYTSMMQKLRWACVWTTQMYILHIL